MKLTVFKKVYIIYLIVLFILAGAVLVAVSMQLEIYEKSQPMKTVNTAIEKLKASAEENTLAENFDLSDYSEDEIAKYAGKIKGSELRAEVLSGSYSDSEQIYGIYSGEDLVAKVKLESNKSKQLLLILTVSDWKLAEIKPVNAKTQYKYKYKFTAPMGITVFVNGTEAEKKELESGTEYTLYASKQDFSDVTITLSDGFGNEVPYKIGDKTEVLTYAIGIPSNFKISLGNTDLSKYLTGSEEIKAYEYCYQYADLPKLNTYTFKNALAAPKAEITDNLGNKVDYEYTENNVFMTDVQAGKDEIPASIKSEVNVFKATEAYSLFLTGDLVDYEYDDAGKKWQKRTGNKAKDKGVAELKTYLHSYLAEATKKWVNSVDYTFTSDHYLKNPPFIDEAVTNFVSYGDDFFSCDIKFVQEIVVSRGTYVPNRFNCTCYFIKNPDYNGKNQKWLFAEKIDVK